ncbi:MAG: GreA/GreB family elongation factor [Chlamydiales bacterium]|nr:GreA/GreB family elongation factor [Chlamydiales bacterium]
MSYLKSFQTHIANHDYPAFLTLWEEYCSGDEIEGEEAEAILKAVKKSDIGEPFGRHVEKIVPLWRKLPASDISDSILRLILDIQTTNNANFAQLAYSHLEKKYGDQASFNEKIRLVGLRSKEKFQGAISNYELLLHMVKGNFVFHTGGWGVGEIWDISLVREQVTIEFDYVPGKKEISFTTAFKTLVPIPRNHFLALRFGSPDLLETKARENPVEVIRMLLNDLGPKTAAEIKDEFCDLVIPAEEWTKWWQAARSKIKKDSMIETPKHLKDPFQIRHSEITHEERLQKILEEEVDTDAFIQLLYTFLRDFPETLKKQDSKNLLISKLQENLSSAELSHSREVQLRLFLQDLNDPSSASKIDEIIQKTSSIEELINGIHILSFKKQALAAVHRLLPNWKELFLELLLKVDQAPLRDYLLSELVEAKADAELRTKLEELCAHPGKYPDTFLWYFQKVMGKKETPFSNDAGKARFFEGLLILLSAIENDPSYRDHVKKIHTLISNARYATVRYIVQNATLESVKELLLLATKCHSLTDHDHKILHSLAEVAHPSLAKIRKKKEGPSADDQTIWTTAEGLQKLKTRIQHIATVETVENAKEIEVARSHGDLRENAEFKAAFEKRDRLQSELKTLSEQMQKARVLSKEDISSSKVGIGSIVECQTGSGKKVCYTLLGPWDANPEQHILSFQSKLAQVMSNKEVGDSFSLQNEEYTIVSIKSFLD